MDPGEMFYRFAISDSLHVHQRLLEEDSYLDEDKTLMRSLVKDSEDEEKRDYYEVKLDTMQLPEYVFNASQCERSFLIVLIDPFNEFKEKERCCDGVFPTGLLHLRAQQIQL